MSADQCEYQGVHGRCTFPAGHEGRHGIEPQVRAWPGGGSQGDDVALDDEAARPDAPAAPRPRRTCSGRGFCPAEVREADLLYAVQHVVRYGKLGKQTKRRLKDALSTNTRQRTHA